MTFDLGLWVNQLTAFVRAHEAWGPPIVAVLAFGESLAFLSLLIPATVMLVAIGGLAGASHVPFWPLWVAGGIGAALGDWLSFAIGARFHDRLGQLWPMSRYPDMLPRGRAFFARWGAAGIFIGRFFGPLRAVVPLIAGACQMRALPFQVANWSSAFMWSAGLLGPGAFGIEWLSQWLS